MMFLQLFKSQHITLEHPSINHPKLFQLIVKLKLNDGLEALDLIWDGNSTVSSTIHGMYYQGTTGLCGSWDDNAENDQISSAGENNDVNEFGWSWKIDGNYNSTANYSRSRKKLQLRTVHAQH